MRWLLLSLCMGIALIFSPGCVTHPVIQDTAPILHVDRLEETDYQTLESLTKAGLPLLLDIPAGTRLPVVVNVQMPMGVIDHQEVTLEIKTNLFLYVTETGVWMSPDKKSWSLVNDLKGMKQVFGFSQGRLDLGIAATREKGPHVNFELTGE